MVSLMPEWCKGQACIAERPGVLISVARIPLHATRLLTGSWSRFTDFGFHSFARREQADAAISS
jgi:hypothetical protein